MRNNKEKFFYIAASLLLAVIILFVLRHVFWRPFTTSTESQDSYTFLIYAQANSVEIGLNPFVARRVNLASSTLESYNHWTNGYYLFANAVLQLLGAEELEEQEMVLRTLAIAAFIIAAFIVISSALSSYPFVYFAIPLALLTNIGRDSVSFIWRDFLFMAVGFFLVARSPRSKFLRYSFRASMVVLPLFLHTVIPYFLAFIVIDFLIHRDKRETRFHALWLLLGTALVLGVLLFGIEGDIAAGWAELRSITNARSILGVDPSYSPRPSLTMFFRFLVRRIYETLNMGLWGFFFVVASWVAALRRKEWWLAALIPAWIFYALVFHGAIAKQYYSYLPYVFFSLVTFLYGLHLVFETVFARFIAPAISSRFPERMILIKRGMEIGLILLVGFNSYLYPTIYPVHDKVRDMLLVPNVYPPDPLIPITNTLNALKDKETRESIGKLGCNAFEFKLSPEIDPWIPEASRVVLGRYVIERIKGGDSLRECLIEITDGDRVNVVLKNT